MGSLLPSGLSPRVTRGFALLELCYTRFASGPARWLPLPHEPTVDHLVLRVAVESTAQRYVFEESFSSWLRAHFGRHESPCSRSAFALAQPDHGLELTVRHRDREVFHVRGEPGAEPVGSVFRSVREAADYLGDAAAWPGLDPLCVFDLRAAWIDGLGIETELDGAFRSSPLRRSRAPAALERDEALEYGPTIPIPYLPGF